MSRNAFKYVDRFIDRHGKTRQYFRPAKGVRVALVGEPNSPEFLSAYQAAERAFAAANAAGADNYWSSAKERSEQSCSCTCDARSRDPRRLKQLRQSMAQ